MWSKLHNYPPSALPTAAQATIAAQDLANGGIAAQLGLTDPLELWTGGQPRAGDAELAAGIQRSVPVRWRVGWRADPTPAVPWEVMGYAHWEPFVWYTQVGR